MAYAIADDETSEKTELKPDRFDGLSKLTE